MQKYQCAFTLVELSIVLVILGLLIGGVLTGQSLIRAAELRSVSTQQARYVTATQTFRDKYFALPGDMTNATVYWGAVASGTACVTTSSAGIASTCNGDGDGKIVANTPTNEPFRFWQHLANAGLIEGNYSGITGVTDNYAANSTNAPAGRISSSLWFAYHWGQQSATIGMFDGQYDNSLSIGGVASADPSKPIFKPEEAYNIDMKVDDGKPATGRMVIRTYNYNCADAATYSALTANYLLTNTAPSCALIFRQAF